MNILGLHFGHDGGVAVVRDGQPAAVLLTERFSRTKHARSLDETMIHAALKAAGITIGEVDFCAITTTQTYPLVFSPDQSVRVTFARHGKDHVPSMAERHTGGDAARLALASDEAQTKLAKVRRAWAAEHTPLTGATQLGVHRTDPERLIAAFAPEMLPRPKFVLAERSLAEIRALEVEARHVENGNRYWMHYPATVTIDGRAIPGAYVDHHAAHAASSYYQSGLKSALIITNDGADRLTMSSGAYLGIDNTIVPLLLPRLWVGSFYDTVAARIFAGCDAGKMMGLAPYGKPAFFADSVIGTGSERGHTFGPHLANAWIEEALRKAGASGYDLTALGVRSAALAPINVDLAASAHQTFEEDVLATIAACKAPAERAAALFSRALEGLCMSGGCALSCPTNTRAALSSGFGRVFVEPSCDDSGLSLGGALWVAHNLLDAPLHARDPEFPVTPYLGLVHGEDARSAALAAHRNAIRVETGGDPARMAAADVAANRIVGWYEGRSEIGPRALGHRSILCDPRDKGNWARTNVVKTREAWRPFAPAVLRDDAARWFENMPLPSPYMLFTGDVIDPAALPAITHVDGTARVQTVTRDCGGFHDVIAAFKEITGCPVVMNTSLNGPGEPIVETPENAVRFFLNSGLDVLYVDGVRITKG